MIKTSTVRTDDVTRAVCAAFDFEFSGETSFLVPEISIPQDYGIGLIVGPSGSGKSSILSSLGTEIANEWSDEIALVSHFGTSDEAISRLGAVGLNSIPSWLKPYSVLSTGEKFRADLARKLQSGAVIDEFTSVIDRNVARSCSVALRRYVDKENLTRVTLASCHYDIIEWLQPDWYFDTATGETVERGSLPARPPIDIEILPCGVKAWSMFRPHHYLSGEVNKSARCWLALWDGIPVGFAASLPFPNGNIKNAWRGHRTVVLPDYQGLGIGVRLSDEIARMHVDSGLRYFSKTAHPRMGEYRESSKNWRPTSKNRKTRMDYSLGRVTKEDGHKMAHRGRLCYSHEYVL